MSGIRVNQAEREVDSDIPSGNELGLQRDDQQVRSLSASLMALPDRERNHACGGEPVDTQRRNKRDSEGRGGFIQRFLGRGSAESGQVGVGAVGGKPPRIPPPPALGDASQLPPEDQAIILKHMDSWGNVFGGFESSVFYNKLVAISDRRMLNQAIRVFEISRSMHGNLVGVMNRDQRNILHDFSVIEAEDSSSEPACFRIIRLAIKFDSRLGAPRMNEMMNAIEFIVENRLFKQDVHTDQGLVRAMIEKASPQIPTVVGAVFLALQQSLDPDKLIEANRLIAFAIFLRKCKSSYGEWENMSPAQKFEFQKQHPNDIFAL